MGVRVAAWFLGALVVGSVAVADPSGLAPFGPAKWLAISTLALLGGGLALRNGQQPIHRPTLQLWVVLLAFLAFGALFGGDIPTALLGEPTRHLGLITWLLFLLLFCAGQQLSGAAQTETITRGAVIATLLIGVWASWELLIGPPIDIASNTDRLTGPFGSAALLGAATCLLVPICASMAAQRTTPRSWRWAAALATFLGTMALIGSGSRAAWLATAVLVILVVVGRRPSRRLVIAGMSILAVAAALLAPRLTDVLDRSEGSGSRLDEWAVAARVIAEHPLIGVGPEGYRIAVSEGVDRHYERTYGRDRVLPDRAHSGPLDVALAGGVPAALAFCALIGFVGWRALGLLRAGGGPSAGIAAGVIAYSAQQLLLFPLAELDPIWWLLAGIVVVADSNATPALERNSVRRLIAGGVLILTPVALVAGVLDVAADRLAHHAVVDANAANAIDSAERAVDLRPDDLRYRMVLAEVLGRRSTLADINAAIRQTELALDWSPHDPIAADVHASFLLDRANVTGQPADISIALAAWQRLVDRDPLRARWQLQLGRAAALAGDVQSAREAWTVAADLSPDDATAADLLRELDSL